MGILEKNEEALRAYDEKFFGAYENIKKGGINHCTIEEAVNHENIICYSKDNYGWRLNSIYEPSRASELYASRYCKVRDYAIVCIFGLSDGRSVRGLLANCNDTHEIVLYEPSVDIFMAAMEMFPLEDILQWKKLHLVVGGINGECLHKELGHVINCQTCELLMQCILPNYDLLFPQEGRDYIDKMIYFSKVEKYVSDTERVFGECFGNNIMHNLPYLLRGSSVNCLCSYMAMANSSDLPAIIVSAGPSLDKNIKELKRAEGKAFIIGVDSALKALIREGIHVNMAVTVDANKNPEVFGDDRVNDMPCMVAVSALPQMIARNRNRLFFENAAGFETYDAIIATYTGKTLGEVESGGSVATDAFSMALAMGFKRIILIGQDLAFTGGKGHVSGFEQSEEADKEHVAKRGMVEVEALGGGTVLTDMQMESYLRWFEMHIAQAKAMMGTTVYNATEGGARIRGSVEITLRDAIAEFCVEEVDFDKFVADVPYAFTDDERNLLRKEFLKSDAYLCELQGKLEKGIRAYEDLIKLERKPNSGQYKETVAAVMEVNNIEANEPYIGLIRLYAKESEYEATEDIYVAEDMSLRDIAVRGITLLEGYVKGIAVCRKRIEEILIPELLQMQE